MRILKLNAIDSTNSFLKNLANDNRAENFTIVVAENQTKGKGQRGSEWHVDGGKNLTFSVLYGFLTKEINLFTLNIIAAISVVEGLKKKSNLDFKIKWPNDIMAENKKIAGILIENSFKSQQEIQTIIGVGINVNQVYFENLPQASSLFILENKIFDKEELLSDIINNLKNNLDDVKTLGEDIFWNKYHDLLFKKDKVSAFEDKFGNKFVGKIIGVNKEGKLKVELENEIITFFDLKDIKLLY